MSAFCQQCSIELFDEDMKELAEFSTPEDTRKGLYAAVLCEGCGSIQVDHNGRCISDCKSGHNHNKQQITRLT
jgi:hypothetical protein